MKNYMYYGEIAARISARLHDDPQDLKEIQGVIEEQPDETYNLHSLSAEAARVFEMAEDLCDEYFIDWHRAVDHFARNIKEMLLKGEIARMLDLYILCAKSIEHPSQKLSLVK